MKCPVCDKDNKSMLCPNCGFDSSMDYGKYPTFGPVGKAPAVSALRREWGQGNPPPPKKKKPWLAIAACAAVLVMGLVVVAGSYWTGWISISGKQYYLTKGHRAIGIITIDNNQYYFDGAGVMQTGWQIINGAKYYFDSDGVMQTGWQIINGAKYYFDSECTMQTGLQTIGTKKYYFDDDGSLNTGWLTLNGQTYYRSPSNDGALAIGKWTIGDDHYYFDADGVMSTGTVKTPSGLVYQMDEEGHFQYCDTTSHTVNDSRSDEKVAFSNRTGSKTWSDYRLLDNGLKNVISMQIEMTITEINYGSGDGQWQVHVRTMDGGWKRVGFFEVKDESGKFQVDFDEPISFDAYACTPYEGFIGSGKYRQEITEATCRTYGFSPIGKD